MAMANSAAARCSIIFLIIAVLLTAKFVNNAAADVKEGDYCDASAGRNCCTGEGTKVLECCSHRCTDVLTCRNNCGTCGRRCGFGQLCCNGSCTTVAYDVNNCGQCGVVCKAGVRCEYGICGYA